MTTAAPILSRPAAPPSPCLPARERAVLGGLFGARDAREPLLAAALAERAFELRVGEGVDPAALARARVGICDELDRASFEAPTLGPYFGFVGRARGGSDPRGADLYVTALESAARCPWRSFVERVLRVERVPDPFEALPEVDPLRLGQVAHGALERLAVESGCPAGGTLAESLERAPIGLRWPAESQLDAWIDDAAREVLGPVATSLPGLARVFAGRAKALVLRARELDTAPEVIGAEVTGAVHVNGRALHFRADRVDARPGGALLTDYKTGKPVSDAVKPETRRERLEQKVREGSHLQASAYARAQAEAGGAGAAIGRYLYLRPDLDPAVASVEVDADAPDLREPFEQAVGALLSARETGCFSPRLVGDQDEEAGSCQRCEVKEACLWGDSGARGRLRRWLDAPADETASEAEAALRSLFALYAGSSS